MDDVALANYIFGVNFGPVEAGLADSVIAKHLGAQAGARILFSDYTLIKLLDKHGEINFSHYRHLPTLLLKGFMAIGRRHGLLELWWIEASSKDQSAYQLVLKATKSGDIYVSTFHRIHLREARRLAKRAARLNKLVRMQSGFESLAQPGK